MAVQMAGEKMYMYANHAAVVQGGSKGRRAVFGDGDPIARWLKHCHSQATIAAFQVPASEL